MRGRLPVLDTGRAICEKWRVTNHSRSERRIMRSIQRSLKLLLAAVGSLVLLFSAGPVLAQAERAALELAEEQAFKEATVAASPSIVRIDTVGGLDMIGRQLTSTASTTGLVIDADGHIVSSAFNFIAKPTSILVTLPDGRRFPAKTVATDRLRMVTLLKIEATGLKPPVLAPKAEHRVGQWSIALGRTRRSRRSTTVARWSIFAVG
jgi:serine protease Do